MNLEDLNGKRVMHIDTSSKLCQKDDTGIAYKIIGSNQHKGLGLKLRFKKEVEKKLNADLDRARLYAICIHKIIKEDLDLFDILVICADEDIDYVKYYLEILFNGDERYSTKGIISIFELRQIIGVHVKSYAHGIANSYRQRALKCTARQQTGTPLNVIKITFKEICEKWEEIEQNKKM
jgi:hypothetical protein